MWRNVFVVTQVVGRVKGFGPQSISNERTGESGLEDVFGCRAMNHIVK